MKTNTFGAVILTLGLCVLAACSHNDAAVGSTAAGDWAANGASACEKYLTPDVVAAIWVHPGGHVKAGSDANSCSYQSDNSGRSIAIMLAKDGPDSFDASYKYLVHPLPLSNVGDKASITANGVVAVKGDDRTCHIDVYGEDASLKIDRAALGRKLGDICNALFALP